MAAARMDVVMKVLLEKGSPGPQTRGDTQGCSNLRVSPLRLTRIDLSSLLSARLPSFSPVVSCFLFFPGITPARRFWSHRYEEKTERLLGFGTSRRGGRDRGRRLPHTQQKPEARGDPQDEQEEGDKHQHRPAGFTKRLPQRKAPCAQVPRSPGHGRRRSSGGRGGLPDPGQEQRSPQGPPGSTRARRSEEPPSTGPGWRLRPPGDPGASRGPPPSAPAGRTKTRPARARRRPTRPCSPVR